MSEYSLEAHLDVGYAGRAVARGIPLQVSPGTIVSIVGPNGAGKTTLLRTLAGLLAPVRGSITVAGETVRKADARLMNKKGVVLVPDNRALFTQLTVADNLNLALRSGTRVEEIFEVFPALRPRAAYKAGLLSGGEQQMLAIGRALAQRPAVLLIDEMSMGLAPTIVDVLVSVLKRLSRDQKTAIVLVEQHLGAAMEVADHVLVLVHGAVAATGSAADLGADGEALERLYLGVDLP